MESKEYKDSALEAVHALKGKIPFFEVNTGAIARGYRKEPYPAPFLLSALKDLGAKIVLGSDCHQKEKMDFWFEEGKEYLRNCGYTERYILTKEGFVPVPL